MEALGYVFVDLLRKLPWTSLDSTCREGATKEEIQMEKHRGIRVMKNNITTAALCEGLPDELRLYMDCAGDLEHNAEPDYNRMRCIFKTGMESRLEKNDGRFCWTDNETPSLTVNKIEH